MLPTSYAHIGCLRWVNLYTSSLTLTYMIIRIYVYTQVDLSQIPLSLLCDSPRQQTQFPPEHSEPAMTSAASHWLESSHLPWHVGVAWQGSGGGAQHVQPKPEHPLSITLSPGAQVCLQAPLWAMQLCSRVQSEEIEGKSRTRSGIYHKKIYISLWIQLIICYFIGLQIGQIVAIVLENIKICVDIIQMTFRVANLMVWVSPVAYRVMQSLLTGCWKPTSAIVRTTHSPS